MANRMRETMDKDKVARELVNIAKAQNHGQIVQKIKELVPEYIGGSQISPEPANT